MTPPPLRLVNPYRRCGLEGCAQVGEYDCEKCIAFGCWSEGARAVFASLRAEGSEVADFYADKYERELESATTGDEGSEGRG